MNRMTPKWIAVQVITLVAGFGALAYSYHASQSDRIQARRDTCQLIIGLVRTGETARTRAATEKYIASTVLHDCNLYAHHPTLKVEHHDNPRK